jgi:hypothetical protein
MKRLLDDKEWFSHIDSLSLEQLQHFATNVNKRVAERFSAMWSSLWREHHDIVDQHILKSLTYFMPLEELLRLRLVCRQWSQWVRRATYLQIPGKSHHTEGAYVFLLDVMFPLVTEAEVTGSVLSTTRHVPGFARLTALKLSPYSSSILMVHQKQWAHLTSLRAMKYASGTIPGLSRLTNLTHLSVQYRHVTAADMTSLERLSRLKSLKIRQFPEDFVPRKCFPLLASLNSDQCVHFVGYTGHGRLLAYWPTECGGDRLVDDPGGRIKALFDQMHPGAYSLDMRGEWEDGVFTGEGRVEYVESVPANSYRDLSMVYQGAFVKGERDGAGVEINEQVKTKYRGSWSEGVRHGEGLLVYCRNFYSFNELEVPMSRQRWVHGVLQESVSL